MRLAVFILMLGAIGVALVHVRQGEMQSRHELQMLQMRQIELRRDIFDQQVRLSDLTRPRDVENRAAAIQEDLYYQCQPAYFADRTPSNAR